MTEQTNHIHLLHSQHTDKKEQPATLQTVVIFFTKKNINSEQVLFHLSQW